MIIVADNTIPFLKGVIEPLGEVRYIPSSQFTAEAVQNADVLIVRSIDKCTPSILEGSRVKLITTATIGFDHIDTRYCEAAGISWKNAPGCNARSVGEYVLACLVTLSLRTNEPLTNKTLGIVGLGHVGREVEALCTAYGMRILCNDPPRAEKEGGDGFVSLDTLAREADIITFHTPLNREGKHPTYHLLDTPFVQRLEKKPWLINSCRGAVHDTSALLYGLEKGKINQLILDCWENEPHISAELLAQTAIATPHIAGFSADGKANATRICLEEISRFFQIPIDRIGQVQPEAPANPFIDLSAFPTNRVEQAILSCFNPLPVDLSLRQEKEDFELFRKNYNYPREFKAYTVLNALPEEAVLLGRLGFNLR
ncbi:4-phosphoerythronate dehydrogenase PdxB [Parabacteroides sp. 52]|uniref:4-phosphoerythronate dehydrogenase PdxB n=1 Tax=unclassified Parabacteroides TaxID=2649774 RepID=UPI0013D31CB8|nr:MULTISPECIES: 4-phosphoerythronate dehydrogenase PdxB [unclassified Parabacteroides]MDH6535492.1 erythronate-4-phosphate dehydrogenase [Parabacteroides sp. PM5-20]NDV55928.1 4-phosphoerythronate dehydrogenase PdxB [Parabacteroides sp. 52]